MLVSLKIFHDFLIDEIRKYDHAFVPVPASIEQLERLKVSSAQKLLYSIPKEYEDFLKTTNGYEWNGVIIYGCEDRYEEQIFKQGFIETNIAFWEVDSAKHFIFFGEASVESFVYNLKAERFQMIDRISLDTIEEFSSFDQLITSALLLYTDDLDVEKLKAKYLTTL